MSGRSEGDLLVWIHHIGQLQLQALGPHGHGAVYRALVGSVAEGVVRGATCPVVVVPARD